MASQPQLLAFFFESQAKSQGMSASRSEFERGYATPAEPRGEMFWAVKTFIRKILVSVKFVSAILGPEMGAPILWTPGKNAFFLQEKPCP